MKKILFLFLTSISLNALAGTSLTVAQIADAINTGQLGGISDLMGSLSYVFGIAFGVKAAFKLKEHSDSKGQTKLHVPILFAIAAALFLALPSTLKVGLGTVGLKSTPSGGGSVSTQPGGGF